MAAIIQRRIGQAFRRHGQAAQNGTARRAIIPASVKGWNTRDSLSNMDPQYAVRLENYFPERGSVSLRRGCKVIAEDIGSNRPIETLFSYRSGTMNRLYAASDGAIYDVTPEYDSLGNREVIGDPDAVTIPSASATITNDRWQVANFQRNAIWVNGSDDPLRIDSSGTFVEHGFTGAIPGGAALNPVHLFTVLPFKRRLFFLERNSARLWYGGVGHVTGTIEAFDLSEVHAAGGNAVGMGTLTLDSGQGVDDLLAVFMDSGEVLIYAGTDISSSDNWALAGIFNVGRIIGDRPIVKLGGDLIAITENGFVPILSFLRGGSDTAYLTLSDAIQSAVTEDAQRYGDNRGWEAILYPRANWLLFNVPEQSDRYAHQLVMNSQTGAWCRFTGYDAACWQLFDSDLYFGVRDGRVMLADATNSDEENLIVGDCQTAYQYLGSPNEKQFRMIRAHLEADAEVQVGLSIGVDFNPGTGRQVATRIVDVTDDWNAAHWNTAHFRPPSIRHSAWQDIREAGEAVSVRLQSETAGLNITWHSTDVSYDNMRGLY